MKLYKSVRSAQDVAALPPQAQEIVLEVRAQGVVRRDQLLETLSEKFVDSRQSAKVIFQYYRGRLINDGYMMELTV